MYIFWSPLRLFCGLFPASQKVSLCPFPAKTSCPRSNHYYDFYQHRLVLSPLDCNRNGITRCVLFCLCPPFLSIMMWDSSMGLYVAVVCSFLITVSYSPTWIDYYTICSFCRRLGCFLQFLTMKSTVAMSVLAHAFLKNINPHFHGVDSQKRSCLL